MIGDILQPTHLIFILVVALLVLGPKRLPEVGRSLGKGIRDFRGAMSGIDEAVNPSATPDASQSAISPVPSTDVTSSPVAPSFDPPTQVVESPAQPAAETVGSTADVARGDTVAVAPAPATPSPAMEFDMSSAFPAGGNAGAGAPAVVVSSPSPTVGAADSLDGSISPASSGTAGVSGKVGVHDPDPADYAD
jgi:TatA/E family protein of Tat protein translocase